MTTLQNNENNAECPAASLLKKLAGKWKPEIFRMAINHPVRFNGLVRQLKNSNKQSIAVALKEMEEDGLLIKTVVREKPLHIQYELSDRGKALVEIFKQLENFS
jgi:DNA-binding HxlR family transcriptional regulator